MIRCKAPAITMLQSTPFLRKIAEALSLFCTRGDKKGEGGRCGVRVRARHGMRASKERAQPE